MMISPICLPSPPVDVINEEIMEHLTGDMDSTEATKQAAGADVAQKKANARAQHFHQSE